MENEKYLKRIVDKQLKEKLEYVGAVCIVGPKWCGKTTTAKKQAKSVINLQDPDKRNSYLEIAEIKPSLLLEGEKPRLIDEWQMIPLVWDAVRTSVDKIGHFGQYILTGSTSVNKKTIMHSGTGRISKIKMYPMSLYESNESNGKISLTELFNNKDLNIDGIYSKCTLTDLIYACCRGGWPSSLQSQKYALKIAKSYFDNICDEDCITVDGVKRSPTKMRNFLRSYARNISSLASDTTIINDLSANDSTFDKKTMSSYMSALEKLFVIDEIEAWCPNIRSKASIRSSNKRQFVDPSIAVSALNLTPELLLQDLHTFGLIFENLCIRDLKIYSQALGGNVSYYRDKTGLESDCVLHLDDGRFALIEIKLGNKQIEDGSKHLLELKSLIEKYNANEKNIIKLKEPDLLMILTGENMAYTNKDGVKVVPIACLKD